MQLYKANDDMPNAKRKAPYPPDFDFDAHLALPAPIALNPAVPPEVRNGLNYATDKHNLDSMMQTEMARAAAGRGDPEVPDVGNPLRAIHQFSKPEVLRVLDDHHFLTKLSPLCHALADLVSQAKAIRDAMSPTDRLQGALQAPQSGLSVRDTIIPTPIVASFAAGHSPPPLLALTSASIERFANGSWKLPTTTTTIAGLPGKLQVLDIAGFWSLLNVAPAPDDASLFPLGGLEIYDAMRTFLVLAQHVTDPSASQSRDVGAQVEKHINWMEKYVIFKHQIPVDRWFRFVAQTLPTYITERKQFLPMLHETWLHHETLAATEPPPADRHASDVSFGVSLWSTT